MIAGMGVLASLATGKQTKTATAVSTAVSVCFAFMCLRSSALLGNRADLSRDAEAFATTLSDRHIQAFELQELTEEGTYEETLETGVEQPDQGGVNKRTVARRQRRKVNGSLRRELFGSDATRAAINLALEVATKAMLDLPGVRERSDETTRLVEAVAARYLREMTSVPTHVRAQALALVAKAYYLKRTMYAPAVLLAESELMGVTDLLARLHSVQESGQRPSLGGSSR